jgi:hypothetical protein
MSHDHCVPVPGRDSAEQPSAPRRFEIISAGDPTRPTNAPLAELAEQVTLKRGTHEAVCG